MEEIEVVETDRHPFRFMLRFLMFVGILYAAGRLLAQQKQKWYGISESEARAKLEGKLSPRMGEDQAAQVADQVISKLKEKGVIKADEPADIVDAAEAVADDAAEAAGDTADDNADAAEDEADAVADAVEEVTKD